MKKILTSLFALALFLVQIVPALPVNAEAAKDGKITINNAIVGQDYSIYQILDLSLSSDKKAYSYKATTNWKEFVESEAISGKYLTIDKAGYVTWVEGADVAAFAKLAIAYAKENNIASEATKKAEGTTVTFENLPLGYYLVDSTTGTICNLTTTAKEVTIQDKNGVPTVDKEVSSSEDGLYSDKNTAKIGDTVYFKTEINVTANGQATPEEAGAINYKLYDTMGEGLTYSAITSIELVRNNATVKTLVKDTDYTITSNAHGFTIDFTESFEKDLQKGDKIVVKYTAVVNEDAIIAGTGNLNDTYLTYGENETKTEHDTTRTYTFKFDLTKENADNEELTGAEFELYASNKETKINLVLEDGVYRVATKEEAAAEGFTSAVIEAGTVEIKGLNAGTYYLRETKAPEGYNKLVEEIEVTISATYDTEGTATVTVNGKENNLISYTGTLVTVVNTTGAELPSTGGMGTVLFLTIGSLMVLGFGVMLVTKLRMAKVSL